MQPLFLCSESIQSLFLYLSSIQRVYYICLKAFFILGKYSESIIKPHINHSKTVWSRGRGTDHRQQRPYFLQAEMLDFVGDIMLLNVIKC